MSIVKNQGHQIQTLTDVVAQYGEVLQAITSGGFAGGPSRKGGPSHVATVNGGSPQEQEVNCSGHEGNRNSTLKRQLDFEPEEIAPKERFINIRQQGYGSPFTVYAYKRMNMLSEDTPECLYLVFWPPKGMTFAGYELPVAAYVFSNGLDMSKILVPDFLARDTREMLWSFRLGKELFDDEIAVDPYFNTQATIEFIEKKYMIVVIFNFFVTMSNYLKSTPIKSRIWKFILWIAMVLVTKVLGLLPPSENQRTQGTVAAVVVVVVLDVELNHKGPLFLTTDIGAAEKDVVEFERRFGGTELPHVERQWQRRLFENGFISEDAIPFGASYSSSAKLLSAFHEEGASRKRAS
ncbi:hypothetical protein PIB30_038172 [Stylosanthes scabra]|uniref:Uncharacterized protein n=1 Tax=Stylosanthes scabra TaxID=79078 RepID=A0ABU6YCR2_9FABA|nr:hypothetical protein [Stylosanthes scabra]